MIKSDPNTDKRDFRRRTTLLLALVLGCYFVAGSADADDDFPGRLNAHPYDPDATGHSRGIANPRDAGADDGAGFLGRLSANPYNADSTSNPYGAGNPYRADSPTNPYGRGLGIYDGDYDGDSEKSASDAGDFDFYIDLADDPSDE